ncbi:hypothetical protein ACFW03_29270, partial [Peribacillus butanolivorans]|uniref:hypothetical protein n=1 Tax=Peribacillus butanolivorans TaxID=421767 RepID=UPI0036A189BC
MKDFNVKINYLWVLFFIFLPLLNVRIPLLVFNISISMLILIAIFTWNVLKNRFVINFPRHSLLAIIFIYLAWTVTGSLYSLNQTLAFKKIIELIFGVFIFITTYNYFI